jgi:OmpA-OmpF porin, OOP family
MCQPKKWWQGLLPLTILWLLTIWFKTATVEADLSSRAAEALKGVMLDEPKVRLAGRDAAVSADAFSDDGQHAAIAAVEETQGVRRVADETKLVPEMHPYAWAAQRVGNKLTLTGNAPAPDVRAKILEAAKKAVPGGEVIDQMAWARGAPASFAALSAFELAELGRLQNGSANLSDGQIAISGEAASSDAYGRIVADLMKLPEGGSLGKIAIVPPEAKPYVWGAVRDGNKITLNGYASVPQVRADLIAGAKKAFPGAEIVDQMGWARGAPADFPAITGYLISELTKLSNGKVNLSDSQMTVEGEAPASSAYDQILTDLKAPPAGAVLAGANILPPEVKPYTWAVARDGRVITLTGNVPTPEARAQLLQAVKKAIPDTEITDHLAYGRGAPASVAELTNFGLTELSKLSKGEVLYLDTTFMIEGEAPTSSAYEEVLADLTKLPNGATLTKAEILPPVATPFSFKGSKEGGSLTLTGTVPSGDVRTQLVDLAKKTIPNVVDNLTYGRGAPALFKPLAAFAVSEISALASGTFAVVDDQLSIAGEASSPAAYEQAISDLKKPPDGAKLGSADIVPPVAKPYTWSAVREGQTVTFSGAVPSSHARAQIMAAAKTIVGANLVDNLTYASGAPTGFAAFTHFALAEIGKVAKGSVTIVDKDISVIAEAPTSAIYEQLVGDLQRLPEGAALGKREILPPFVKPYIWSADRDGNSVSLAGNVPTPEARAQLIDAAKKLVGPSVTDQMAIARGAPGNFAAVSNFGLDALSKLAKGSIRVADTQLTIEGEAASSSGFDQLTNSLKKVPEGAALAKANVLPPLAPTYAWSAGRDGAGLTMTGYVPSPDVRTSLVDLAKKNFIGLKIDDQMSYARGAPGNFATVASFGLDALGKLAQGRVAVTGNQFSVEGEAATSLGYDQLTNTLKKLPEGVDLARANVLPPTASPYTWSAKRDNAAVTMSGTVPSSERRASLEDLAGKLFSGLKIKDQTTYARGAPSNFAAISSFGLSALGRLAIGTVGLTDNQLTIEGEAANSNEFEELTTALKKLPEGATLSKANVLPPVANPFVWSAKRDGALLTMNGNVPSSELRAKLVNSAKQLFSGAEVDDQMSYARGAPNNWGAAAELELQQLAKLRDGEAGLSGTKMSLRGDAADPSIRNAVEEALRDLPGGFALSTHAITAPEPPPPPAPMVLPAPPVPPPTASAPPAEASFTAVREAGALTLSGIYPDEKAHEEIVDAAQRKFFSEVVVDQMRQSNKAVKPAVSAALAGLDQLSRLANGSVGVSGNVIRLAGATLYGKAVEQIQSTARDNVPAGFKIETDLTVKPPETVMAPDACQKLFVDLVSRGKIRFETGKATIHKDSFGILDFAVYNALRCAAGNIEIAGHTDSDGSKDANLDLSKRRAQAVVDYLVNAGIDPQRLSAVGFGDTHPVASNDTEEGKAENRRIEFSVK